MTDVDAPLYELQDRRCSGEWRPIASFKDPSEARQAEALLRAAGADVRLETIPSPFIP